VTQRRQKSTVWDERTVCEATVTRYGSLRQRNKRNKRLAIEAEWTYSAEANRTHSVVSFLVQREAL
jgi:hypothetical protein